MNKFIGAFLVGLSLIIISNIVGHYYPPSSILVTAILPFIIVSGVNRSLYKINFLAAILYGYGLIILNDVLIRKYAGGTHDQVGNAWITLFSFIAYLLSSVWMLGYAFRTVNMQEDKSIHKQRIQNVFEVLLCAISTATLYMTLLVDI